MHKSLNRFDRNQEQLQTLNDRVKLAQKEALVRYYGKVEQEVMDQTKIAREAQLLNSAF